MTYQFLTGRPFAGGKVWISTWKGKTEEHTWLLDIERRTILGDLRNAFPECLTADGSKLLCLGSRDLGPRGIAGELLRVVRQFLRGSANRNNEVQEVWILDLQRNSARRIGQVLETRRTSSHFVPSPDGRYAYDRPTGTYSTPGFFLCDLEEQTLSWVTIGGSFQGWWDSRHIALKNAANDFILYDIASGRTNTLLTAAAVSQLCRAAGLEESSDQANLFTSWNGSEYNFFLTDTLKRWQAGESFLIQLEKPSGLPKLISPQFKFEWSDHFSPSVDYYIYAGREAGAASSAVFARDLRTGTNFTLVPDDGARSFSIPNLYSNGVIYCRSNALWRVDLNGSNEVRLFPPS